jgi:NitT/TauT family transport system permease protein
MTAGLSATVDAGAAGTLPVRLRLGLREWLPPAAVLIAFVVGWELVCVVLQLKQFVLPRPTAIATAWVTYLPDLTAAASFTFGEIVTGLLIGSVAGIVAGTATARFAAAREAILPFAIAANSVPILAFAPIFNNWFGVETQLSKAMVAAVLCFFPVMINTVRGLTGVPAAAVELMRSYAASEATVFRKLRVPHALPFVFTALRLATTLATIGAIVGEYFAAPRASLGQYIATHSSFLNFERSWAAIIFAAAIGIGLYLAVVLVERAVMPWYRSASEDDGR